VRRCPDNTIVGQARTFGGNTVKTVICFVLMFGLQSVCHAQDSPRATLASHGKGKIDWLVRTPDSEVQEMKDAGEFPADFVYPRVRAVDGQMVDVIQYIDAIPAELRDVLVYSEQDLIGYVTGMTITGAEELRFVRKREATYDPEVEQWLGTDDYYFHEWIDGIDADMGITVSVDHDTNRIVEFNGRLLADNDLPRAPEISKETATKLAVKYIKHGGKRTRPHLDSQVHQEGYDIPVNLDGIQKAELLYQNYYLSLRGYALVWRVSLELDHPTPYGTKFATFLVGPDKKVEPVITETFFY
jgi:hypothetical protein